MTYQLEYKRGGSGFYESGLAGETLGAHKLVYLDTNGLWKHADADAVAAFPVVGITLEAISNGKYGRILIKGYVGDAAWAWTDLGAPIYATSTAGELSQTQPSDETKVQIVAMAKESDLILFDTGLNYQAALFYANSNNWDDIRFPASGIRLGGASPATFQAYKDGGVLAFASNVDQYVYLTSQLPHSWVEGTDIVAHIHWTIPTSGGGLGVENVKWDLTYSWANIDGSFPNSSSKTVTVDVQNTLVDTHLYSAWVALTGTGKTFSSMLIISIKRDISVANDYASSAYLTEFDIHYKKNRLGTINENPS